MDHQDWESIVVKIKNNSLKAGDKKNHHVKTNETKLEEQVEDGKLSHKKMDANYGKELQKKRLSKGMTQKDLANKINVPLKMINEIESGKAKHNGQLMNKLHRVFQ